jgi:sec-independent protein translocase protein TatC
MMRASFMNMPDVKMTFTEHLAELRTRIIRSLIAVGVCGAGGFVLSEKIFELMRQPLGGEHTLQGLSPIEFFTTRLNIALHIGVFLGLPVILYQMMMFVMPALKPRERSVVLGGLLSSGFLTIAGLTVAFILVLPKVFPVLESFAPEGVVANYQYEKYVNIVFRFLIAFAVGFQFPIVMVSLVHLGVFPVSFFVKNAKYVLILILVASAMFTPPDVMTQVFMAVPLFGLYILSLGVAYIFRKRES